MLYETTEPIRPSGCQPVPSLPENYSHFQFLGGGYEHCYSPWMGFKSRVTSQRLSTPWWREILME